MSYLKRVRWNCISKVAGVESQSTHNGISEMFIVYISKCSLELYLKVFAGIESQIGYQSVHNSISEVFTYLGSVHDCYCITELTCYTVVVVVVSQKCSWQHLGNDC